MVKICFVILSINVVLKSFLVTYVVKLVKVIRLFWCLSVWIVSLLMMSIVRMIFWCV